MNLQTALVMVSLLTASPVWAINKCPDAGGSVVFQDAPCPGSTQTVGKPAAQSPVQPKPVMSAAEVARSLNAQMDQPDNQQRAQESLDRREADRKSIAAVIRSDRVKCGPGALLEQPVIGMTESNFLACARFARDWSYSRVNETETAAGVRRQYVYAAGAPIRYVYTDQGQVVSITR